MQQFKHDSLTNKGVVAASFGAAFYSLVHHYCQEKRMQYESLRGVLHCLSHASAFYLISFPDWAQASALSTSKAIVS